MKPNVLIGSMLAIIFPTILVVFAILFAYERAFETIAWLNLVLMLCFYSFMVHRYKLNYDLAPKEYTLFYFLIAIAIGIGSGIVFADELSHITVVTGTLIIFVICSAIVEELIFRNLMLGIFKKIFTFETAAFLQAFAFSVLHHRFTIVYLAGYFLFGLTMAYLLKNKKKGGLIYAIIAHVLANITELVWIM